MRLKIWAAGVAVPLMEERTDRRLGELTQTVMELDAGEPEESLFEVPAGYAIRTR